MVRCWETFGESLFGERLLRAQLCRGLGLWGPCCGDTVVETVVEERDGDSPRQHKDRFLVARSLVY